MDKKNIVALRDPVFAFKRMIKQIISYLFPSGKLEKARRQGQYKDFFIFFATGLAFYFLEKKIQNLISVQPADLKALQDQSMMSPPGGI